MPQSNRGLLLLLAASLYMGFLARGPGAAGPQGALVGPDSVGAGSDLIDSDAGGSSGATGGSADRADGASSIQRTAQQSGQCVAGRNGGETDTGVTATRIRLATTAVLDGPAKTLLQDSPTAMKAVVNKVNRSGGICGRLLDLKVVNDSFEGTTGQRFIENFIAEGYFALPVVPSAEGLSAAIDSGSISRAGIPVVGTDGMRVEQYRESWVWPVATATVSTMRVMADYGYRKKGAKRFAIVWDSKYQFGREGATAFKEYVEKLGGTIVADVKLNPDQPSYGSEVNNFNTKCGAEPGCDMVALLLLPDAAVNWFKKRPLVGTRYTAGAQTLFSDDFARRCISAAGNVCNGIDVWTGYVPPIGRFAGLGGVEAYVNDVKSVRPGIDTRNQFVEGAHLGMSFFVEALRRVGPNLTRVRLREVLDSMTYETDLASRLSWRPGKHAANRTARAFSIIGSARFDGWRDERTGWIADPMGGP